MDPSRLKLLVVTADLAAGREIEVRARASGHEAILVPPGSLPGARELASVHAAIVDARCGPAAIEGLASFVGHVIVSGERGSGAEILMALRAGAADFLPRDLRPGDLEAALAAALEKAGSAAAVLEIEEAGSPVRQVRILGGELTIGRDSSSDLCLESVVVSRVHARILRKGDHHTIVDCGSRHGVFVNDRKVEEGVLADGARIRLGGAGAPVLTFRAKRRAGESGPSGPGWTGGGGDGPGTASLGDRHAERRLDAAGSSQEMRDIAALVDTFLKLNGDLLLDDLLGIVLARSVELADAERGAILLTAAGGKDEAPAGQGSNPPGAAEQGGGDLRLALARDRDGSTLEEEGLALSRRIPDEVMKTGKGVILEDLLAPEKASDHPSTIQIGVRSAMCVPLRTRRTGAGSGDSQVLGVLYLDSTARSRPFPPRLLDALESLASEAAQAIFNSRLYEECLEKRGLDAEMRIARGIQRSLLPPASFRNEWVELHGSSQPSKEVGGDLLDYHVFGGDRLQFVVGDVSGKGIPAAIFSSMLDGLCYGLGAQPAADLGEAAGELNRFLASKAGHEKFVSAILGRLLAAGRLAYVNAGHNPPLVVRPGAEAQVLREHGVVLGAFEDAKYAASEVQLAPGDALVLYSDGITEAKAESGERFGLARLAAAAAGAAARGAQEVHDEILAAAARFAGGAPPEDDVTLMVVKYLGRPAP